MEQESCGKDFLGGDSTNSTKYLALGDSRFEKIDWPTNQMVISSNPRTTKDATPGFLSQALNLRTVQSYVAVDKGVRQMP